MIIFVDASAFISSLVSNQSHHVKAKQIASKLEEQGAILITSSMIIGEVLTVLNMRDGKELTLDFGERIRNNDLEIVHPSPDHFETAWNIFKREKNKNVSFVDCMSFALIKTFKIQTAFSFDKQFLHRGFEVLR
ncbi:MAG: PIN domain-containing protein [Patescibacteria group bacterium]